MLTTDSEHQLMAELLSIAGKMLLISYLVMSAPSWCLTGREVICTCWHHHQACVHEPCWKHLPKKWIIKDPNEVERISIVKQMIGKHYIIDPSLTNLLQGLLIFIIQLGNTATNLVTSTLQPNIYNRKHLLVSRQQQIQSSSNFNWNALPLHSSGAIWKGGKNPQKNKTTNAYYCKENVDVA